VLQMERDSSLNIGGIFSVVGVVGRSSIVDNSNLEIKKTKFQVGDVVSRRQDVHNIHSPLMFGKVTRCYSRPAERIGEDLILGPYPELYDVRWEGGFIDAKGYLPHGLDPA